MIPIVPEDIERYAESHTDPPDPIFAELREETFRAMSSPEMQVGAVEGRLLKMLVEISGARRAQIGRAVV